MGPSATAIALEPLASAGSEGYIAYAILLAFAGLVFWSPEVLFTWVFNGVFQMARYPVGMYPGWLKLVLTWVIPVGVITTLPAEALSGVLSPWSLLGGIALGAFTFGGLAFGVFLAVGGLAISIGYAFGGLALSLNDVINDLFGFW